MPGNATLACTEFRQRQNDAQRYQSSIASISQQRRQVLPVQWWTETEHCLQEGCVSVVTKTAYTQAALTTANDPFINGGQ